MTEPAVSVVVPTRDTARTVAACLRSIRSQTYPDVELIVVDNFSSDETAATAWPYADTLLHCGPTQSAQRNAGVRASWGDIVVFVDADMVLEPTVLAEVVAAFESGSPDGPPVGAVVVPERSFGIGFLAGCRALEKRLYERDGRVEAARAFSREALKSAGGFDERLMAGLEHWDLADRVAAAGYATARTSSYVWHDVGRISLRYQFRKKHRYGHVLRTYYGGDLRRRPLAPAVLVSRPGLLLRQPHRVAGLAVLKSVEWAGLLTGALRTRG
jgi:glycosyltransferase involved in cell wall biosynthesis